MKYKDYIKESSTLVMSAIDDIITMFKKKKVTEIKFEVPLTYSFRGEGTCSIKEIILRENIICFIDENGFGHIVGNLSNKMDIFTIYHYVYKHLYENVNVARKLQ